MAKKREKLTTGLDHGLRLRNGIYHYRFSWKGQLQMGSCKTTNKREAEDYLARIKSKMRLEDIDVRVKSQATLKEVYDLYMKVMEPQMAANTMNSFRICHDNHWQNILGLKVKDLQPEVDRMHKEMVDRGMTKGTIRSYLCRLKTLIEFGRRRNMHQADIIFPKVKVARDPKVVLDEDQITEFFRILEERFTLDLNILIRSMYYCGLRVSEALRMGWDDLNEDFSILRIDERQKNGKITNQRVPEEMRQWFARKQRKPGELICPSRKGGEHQPKYTLYAIAQVSKMMGLKTPISHHRLRASMITTLIRKGHNPAVVARISRHSDNGALILRFYAETNDPELDLAIGDLSLKKAPVQPLEKVQELQVS